MKIDMRGFVLDNRDALKNIMPTDDQARILKVIRSRTKLGFRCTSFDLSAESGISIQNASTKLRKLFDMGWLVRKKLGDPTGGCYYSYITDF